jgi:hypothetical protein
MDKEMLHRLEDPIAKGAMTAIIPMAPLQTVTSPNPILDKEPREELDFRRSPNPPHRGANRGLDRPIELCLVRGLGRVVAILREVPSNLIHNPGVQGEGTKPRPKRQILSHMRNGECRFHINLGNPSVIT